MNKSQETIPFKDRYSDGDVQCTYQLEVFAWGNRDRWQCRLIDRLALSYKVRPLAVQYSHVIVEVLSCLCCTTERALAT